VRSAWPGILIVTAMWVLAGVVHLRLPPGIPSHGHRSGAVDGWMARPWGLVALPITALLLAAVLLLLPRLDPRRANVERFRGDLHAMLTLLGVVLAALHVATLGATLGWPVDAGRVVVVLVGLLLAGIGHYLPRVPSNWFIGIRTPWTLESDAVWRSTHRLAGRTFVAAGVAVALAAFLPPRSRGAVMLAAIVLAAMIPTLHSFVAWRRERG
jgi:uncharacterized membrane protein